MTNPSFPYLLHDVGHVADVGGDEEVGGSDAPDAELCAVFGICLTGAVLQGTATGATLHARSTHKQLSTCE